MEDHNHNSHKLSLEDYRTGPCPGGNTFRIVAASCTYACRLIWAAWQIWHVTRNVTNPTNASRRLPALCLVLVYWSTKSILAQLLSYAASSRTTIRTRRMGRFHRKKTELYVRLDLTRPIARELANSYNRSISWFPFQADSFGSTIRFAFLRCACFNFQTAYQVHAPICSWQSFVNSNVDTAILVNGVRLQPLAA